MTKTERHESIRGRASEAILSMYHNATPKHPTLEDSECSEYEDWFYDAAQFEIEYIQSGGAYVDMPKDTTADHIEKKYENPKTGYYARRKYFRDKVRERARYNCQWERISEYGKLYQFGRGGRTLAPENLIHQGGGSSFSMDESAPDEMTISDCIELIVIVESFNRVVQAWCKAVPELWTEYEQENVA